MEWWALSRSILYNFTSWYGNMRALTVLMLMETLEIYR